MNIYNPYYAYYSEIEKSFLETERYVAIDSLNYKTYSVRYNWLIQSICSEVDSIFKVIAKKISKKKYKSINEYYVFAKDYIPTLFNNTLEVSMRNVSITPFINWTGTQSPSWWGVYNGIKHNRDQCDNDGIYNYQKANLENTLNALGALYLLENYLIVFNNYDNNTGARNMLEARGRLLVCTEWKKYYQGFMGQKLFPYNEFVLWLRSEGVKC